MIPPSKPNIPVQKCVKARMCSTSGTYISLFLYSVNNQHSKHENKIDICIPNIIRENNKQMNESKWTKIQVNIFNRQKINTKRRRPKRSAKVQANVPKIADAK